MEKKLLILIKILVGASFFIPLLLFPKLFIFPFIVPKVVVFRLVSVTMLVLFSLLLIAKKEEYRVRITAIHSIVGIYLASFAISTFFGVDWYKSFWDNHERMLGLFTFFHYVIFFVITGSVLKDWTSWRFFFRLFLFAGAIPMLIGVIQKIQPDFLLNHGSDRVSATLGNAIYLGSYGLFLVCVAGLLFLKDSQPRWRWYYACTGLLGLSGMFASGTRSVFLAFVAALIVLFVTYGVSLKEHKRVRQTLFVLLIAGAAMFAVLFVFRKTSVVSNIPTIGRLLNTTASNAGTRVIAWEIAFQAWKEQPIFGWGPNNYYFAFNKYYNPESLRFGYGETWFDNAHNAFLNTLAVQGLFGLFMYLGLFIVPAVSLWRAHTHGIVDPHVASIGTAYLVAHFIEQLFVFENPTSYLYFFFFLAFLSWSISVPIEDHAYKSKKLSIASILTISIAGLFVMFVTDINPARANMATLNTLKSVYAGNAPVDAFEKALSIGSPHIDDIRNDFARVVADTAQQYAASPQNREVGKQLLTVAFSELKKNLQLHEGDIRVHLQMTHVAQMLAEFYNEPASLYEAEQIMADAITFSPKRQQLYFTLAGVKYQLQKIDETINLLKQSIALDPLVSEGWWRLATVYQHAGQKDLAIQTIREAISAGVVFNGEGKKLAEELLPGATTGGVPLDTASSSVEP